MDKKVHYRDYMKALRELREQLKGGDEEIYQLSRDDEPIELGTNWPAIGTASAERAMRVAARIIVAAEAVDKFPYNGYIQDFSDPAAPDGGDIKSPIPVVKEKPVGTDENAFIAKLLIPKKQLDTIDGYLDAKTGYEFQGKGRIICNGVRFPDGAVVDIKCCGRDNDASWTESVLFKKESAVGHLVDIYHTDAKDSYRGEYELHDDAVGVIYRIIVENGGDIDEAQLIPLQNAARYEASGGWAVNGCNVPKKRYVALIRSGAVRDAQYCTDERIDPEDDDSWEDTSRDMFVDIYSGAEEEIVRKVAAVDAHTVPENIRLIEI